MSNWKFPILSKVKIKELNVTGLVIAIYITISSLEQYEVRYFSDGAFNVVYFYPDELEEL